MASEAETLDTLITAAAKEARQQAVALLREAIRIPADYVDRPPKEGGDPECGLSNHEGPRLEYLRQRIIELGAVDDPADVDFDAFGNLRWTLEDPNDGVAPEDKVVICLDGHTDTVQALRPRWREAIGGVDAYDGLIDEARIDEDFLRRELGYLPPRDEWKHLLWGRGSADQLGGVICQIMASATLRRLRHRGALKGVVMVSYATVAEEDNDGGGPMYFIREELKGVGPERIPDVVILTEGNRLLADRWSRYLPWTARPYADRSRGYRQELPRLDALGRPQPARVRRSYRRRGGGALPAGRGLRRRRLPRRRQPYGKLGVARDTERLCGSRALHLPARSPAHGRRGSGAGAARCRRAVDRRAGAPGRPRRPGPHTGLRAAHLERLPAGQRSGLPGLGDP